MKKGKGVGRGVLEKLKHEQYVNSIKEYNKIFQVRTRGIRQQKMVLSRVEMRKIGFHALDTKRFIFRGGVKTLAFGNYRIKDVIEEEAKLENEMNGKNLSIVEISFPHSDAIIIGDFTLPEPDSVLIMETLNLNQLY